MMLGRGLIGLSVVTLCTGSLRSTAQETGLGVSENIENAVSQQARETDFTEILEKQEELKKHPLDLNTASREELEQSFLFNDFQVQGLLQHIEKSGPLISLQELQAIEGFDLPGLKRILPYVTINAGPDAVNTPLQVIDFRVKRVLETQKGYAIPDEGKTRYAGSPLFMQFRYRGQLPGGTAMGLTGQKDPGEHFFKGSKKQGFDYYSGYLVLKGKNMLKKVIMGDFEVNYGQGLSTWSGFSFNKTTDTGYLKKYGSGIRPHTSSDENAFLRGVAFSLVKKGFTLDGFYSSRRLDGNTIRRDSISNEVLAVSSLQETGYHRTQDELADQGALTRQTIGGRLGFVHSTGNMGISAVSSSLSIPLIKGKTYYNRSDPGAQRHSTVSLDYDWLVHNMSFFGEASAGDGKGIAVINGLLISLDPRLSLSVVSRFYGQKFVSVSGNAFGESSSPNNEEGIFLSMQYKLSPTYMVGGYMDMYSFPGPKYGVRGPSAGRDYTVLLSFQLSGKLDGYVRAKIKTDEKSNSSATGTLQETEKQELRMQVNYKVFPGLTFHSRVEANRYSFGPSAESGFLIFQDVAWKVTPRVSASMRYVVFDTDSYDTRIYTYENDVPGSFSIPSIFYRGSRYYILLRYGITKSLETWVKWSQTEYDGRSMVGSGLDEIRGNSRSDISLEIRMRF